jgi:hypothetical protein
MRNLLSGAWLGLMVLLIVSRADEPTQREKVRWELEVGQLWQDVTSERPLSVTAYELGAVVPAWGGELNVELEGGQRSDGDRTAYVQDFIFNLNQMIEASAGKVGKVIWRKSWSPEWHTVIGRFAPESYLDKITYASSKTTRFLARPFVRPTAVADPGTSVGLLVRRDFRRVRVLFTTNDANGTGHLSPSYTLKGEWFHAAEIQIPRGERGRSRLVPWMTERGGRSGGGLSASQEESLTRELGWFVRGGIDKGGLARTSRVVATGFSWEPTKVDRFAVAYARGNSGPDGRRREELVEAYVRRAFTPEFSVSVHGQHSQRSIHG